MSDTGFFGSNIKFLRSRKQISQQRLAEELGITRSQLSAYEKGQTRNPTIELMLKLSAYFRLSLDILIKIDLTTLPEIKLQGYQSRSDGELTGREMRVIVTTVDVHGKQNIEHVPIKAKAGYLAGYADPDFISKLPVYSLPHLPVDRKFRSFQTQGDSMYPFPEKTIIVGRFVDDWTTLGDRTLCVVVTQNEGIVFKSVHNHIATERTLWLHSLNPAYEPFAVPVQEVLEIWSYHSYISDSLPHPPEPVAEMLSEIRGLRRDVRDIKKRLQ